MARLDGCDSNPSIRFPISQAWPHFRSATFPNHQPQFPCAPCQFERALTHHPTIGPPKKFASRCATARLCAETSCVESQASPAQQQQAVKMGRVRTKTVKKSAKVIIERYYPRLTLDFETNKRVCDEIAIIASKRLRNKVRFFFLAFAALGIWKRACAGGRRADSCDLRIVDTDCRLHDPPDEAHPARPRPWHLVQAAGGGARAQGPIRPRGVGPRLHPELGERPARRRQRDQGPAQAPWRTLLSIPSSFTVHAARRLDWSAGGGG